MQNVALLYLIRFDLELSHSRLLSAPFSLLIQYEGQVCLQLALELINTTPVVDP